MYGYKDCTHWVCTYGIADMNGRGGGDSGRTALLGDRLGGGQDHTRGTGLQHVCTTREGRVNVYYVKCTGPKDNGIQRKLPFLDSFRQKLIDHKSNSVIVG